MVLRTGFVLAVSVLLALGTVPAPGKTLNEQLIEAARDGHLDAVEALIREGAKVDARTDALSTPLILAASTGNVAIVQALLKAGADVNATNSSGSTALMFVASAGDAALARILLDAKARVNVKDVLGRTALHFAARAGKIEAMELLLAAGADPSAQDFRFLGTPLHHAAIGGNADAVRCLLKHGCPVNLRDSDGTTPLHSATIGRNTNTNVIAVLLEAGADINAQHSEDGSTPLMWAVQSEQADSRLLFLIKSRAALNKTDHQGWTALMRAKVSGQDEVAKILKQAGGKEYKRLSCVAATGDVAVVRSLLAKRGLGRPRQKELDAALYWAAQNRHAAIIKELLAHGANPNARPTGDWTPLFFACRNGDVESARTLVAVGANVNSPRDLRGRNETTPLMYAASSMPAEFVNELISKGANVNATTEKGDTAAGWAALGGKLENMKALLQHGAKPNIRVGKAIGYPGWPITQAISRDDVKLVDFLLAHGADINTDCGNGKTLLMYAGQCNKLDVVKLLIARGADVSAQAAYDYNNTARKLAENTGKTEIAALLRIAEFEDPSGTRIWGAKLKRALAESIRTTIDDGSPDNTALVDLTKEIAAAPDIPPAMKADAQYLAATAQQRLDATRASRGQAPLDLKFQAVDGSDVDMAKLRGKVVLVDFWATWCGPCRAEVPKVVAAYNKFHDHGFEVIGISLDQDKERLVNVTKQAGMTWPQYFDGKGWANEISSRYGINSIPAGWLLDKKGFVRFTDVRGDDLAAQVKALLAE